MDIVRRCVAEFIGTFALVFFGVGSVIFFAPSGKDPNLLGIALSFGLAVGVMVSATLHISGGQFNPAVTVALLVTRKMSPHDALFYILTQLLGAVAAASVLQLMFGGYVTANGATVPVAVAGFNAAKTLWLEVILTFTLVFVIFGVAVDKRGPNYVAGLLIGLTVALDIMLGGPYTGASMNPARSFGPALIGRVWDSHWVYWVGPLLGGALAGQIYHMLFLPRPNTTATTTA
jgi:MIP family channel proteins